MACLLLVRIAQQSQEFQSQKSCITVVSSLLLLHSLFALAGFIRCLHSLLLLHSQKVKKACDETSPSAMSSFYMLETCLSARTTTGRIEERRGLLPACFCCCSFSAFRSSMSRAMRRSKIGEPESSSKLESLGVVAPPVSFACGSYTWERTDDPPWRRATAPGRSMLSGRRRRVI